MDQTERKRGRLRPASPHFVPRSGRWREAACWQASPLHKELGQSSLQTGRVLGTSGKEKKWQRVEMETPRDGSDACVSSQSERAGTTVVLWGPRPCSASCTDPRSPQVTLTIQLWFALEHFPQNPGSPWTQEHESSQIWLLQKKIKFKLDFFQDFPYTAYAELNPSLIKSCEHLGISDKWPP